LAVLSLVFSASAVDCLWRLDSKVTSLLKWNTVLWLGSIDWNRIAVMVT